MKAIAICLNTKQLLKEKKEIYGVIHSVFNQVCNIETKDHILIPLISRCIPNMPRCISLHMPQTASMHSLGLVKGQQVMIRDNLFKIVDEKFQVQLVDAAVWDGRPDFNYMKLEESMVLKNLSVLRNSLLKNGNFDGIAAISMEMDKYFNGVDYPDGYAMNQYARFIWPRVLKLVRFILEENYQGIQNAARQIIGFGIGLTPSADDLLAGIMIAMVYGANYYEFNIHNVYDMHHVMITGVENRTTKISAEMLLFAARGEIVENVRQLMISIFSIENQVLLTQRILSVIENGETSGSDCIAGIYIGCLLSVMKNKERKMKR
ncbi:hypothetical protein HNQ80_003004 [Anaerosolibacter carboniphilus]|uniref:DUF2877 domain-containing protein n=1 Tax=Anaerosolibacter carboniphilus TaxID=1417629 RepID=A0A841L3D2_9FIRM|nr:DUF2877 domain-containing protein [Anaerosolibacter carboniphilus]MBB6216899.1 hypothetical protein [Anaerosolibacter carboniphilus]